MEKKNLLLFFFKKKYYFQGGIKYSCIEKELKNYALSTLSLPKKFFIFIKINDPHKKIRIKKNQKVLRGQPLIFGDEFTVPIHAPTSGYIEEVFFDCDVFEKKHKNINIIIRSDFLDQWIKLKPIENYKKYTEKKLIQIIHQSGIVGLGGAEFPSSKKIELGIQKKVHTLVVNAVESEPYITADNCLMYNYLSDVLEGSKFIAWILKIQKILIVIQPDKIKLINKINKKIFNESLFKLCIIEKKYPGGNSKVLIKALTGQDIPHQKHSVDIGYIVFNVATIFSIKKAIFEGYPLTERIITVLNKSNFISKNFWVRIGTPIKNLLDTQKNKNYLDMSVYLGGWFLGKKTHNLNHAILKNINCIWTVSKKIDDKKNIIRPCIKCSYCSNVCPVNLLPQKIYFYSIKNDHIQSLQNHVLDCIECKACEKVCPSHIRLVKSFKKEKKIVKEILLEENLKTISAHRFQEKEKRISSEVKKINPLYLLHECIERKNKKKYSTFEKKDEFFNEQEKIRKNIVRDAIKRMKKKRCFK